MEINSIIVTLSIMLLTNVFGLVYSYLITSKGFLNSSKLQSRSYKEDILKKRLPLILFNLFFLIMFPINRPSHYLDDFISAVIVTGSLHNGHCCSSRDFVILLFFIWQSAHHGTCKHGNSSISAILSKHAKHLLLSSCG